MAHNITATQARNLSASDLVIYNEIDTITRAINTAALAGELSTVVNDGTTMTESTPTITVTGSVANPVAGGVGESLTLAGSTVTIDALEDLDQMIASINDAAISGLTASKNSSNQIVLTYVPPMGTWSFVIDADSANATLGLTAGTTTATTPESVSYYNMWSGQIDDRKKSYEFSQVVQSFQNDGFNIVAKQNTASAQTTFLWEIYW